MEILSRYLTTLMFLILVVPLKAAASPISPGFDLFTTPAGTAFVDLSSLVPGGGIIPLESNVLPMPPGLGNTDTIVQRFPGLDPFNLGDTGTVNIELVALSLRSVAPVDVGGTLFDLEVLAGSLFPAARVPPGVMTIDHAHPAGGTMNGILQVLPDLVFTQVGNPLNTFTQPSGLDLQFILVEWSHIPLVLDPHIPPWDAGNLFAGVSPPTVLPSPSIVGAINSPLNSQCPGSSQLNTRQYS